MMLEEAIGISSNKVEEIDENKAQKQKFGNSMLSMFTF